MNRILLAVSIIVTVFCDISKEQLAAEITTTTELVELYQKKLELLLQLYHHHFPNSPIPPSHPQPRNQTRPQIPKVRNNQHLVLLKTLPNHVQYFPNSYLLSNNAILRQEDYSQVAQFLGDLLQVEKDQITTLVAGKIGMTYLRSEQGKVRKEQDLLGRKAEKMRSLWHRNLNLKDGEDILVQWEQNRLFFRGRQVRQMELSPQQQVLNVFSLNQYKVIFVSKLRIGVINSRSLQMGQCIQVHNITHLPHSSSQVQIISAIKADATIMILLNTGEVARYFNERIVWIQSLPGIKGELSLLAFYTKIQVLGSHLFILDQRLSLLKMFSIQGSRYHLVLSLPLPKSGQFPQYEVFEANGSYRLIASTSSQSFIFEIIVPAQQEPAFSISYFKVIGVIAIVCVLIYFKIGRNEDDLPVKGNSLRKGDIDKRQFGYNGQVEEYLKRKKLEGLGKQKKV